MRDGLIDANLVAMYPEAPALLERYSKYIAAVETARNSEMDIPQKVTLAVLLENLNRLFDRAKALYETTQPADVGPFKKYAMELVTATIPNLIANDLVSVQPMS